MSDLELVRLAREYNIVDGVVRDETTCTIILGSLYLVVPVQDTAMVLQTLIRAYTSAMIHTPDVNTLNTSQFSC